MAVKARKLLWLATSRSYEYNLEAGKRLRDYNLEAQGDILADYYVLTVLKDPACRRQHTDDDDIGSFKEVLRDFLANPKDPSNLP